MRKNLLFLILSVAIGTFCMAQTVNIPDANFKAYLVDNSNINLNGDEEIQVSEAEQTTQITCGDSDISDLTGIEAFTSLYALLCNHNNLSELDLSSNQELVMLYCGGNELVDLDISMLPNLKTLNCVDNNLSSLNIANGNNENFDAPFGNSMNATGNPNLTCVQIDEGFIPPLHFTWQIDETGAFSYDCSNPDNIIIVEPNPDLTNYFNLLPGLDSNNDGGVQISEANEYTGELILDDLNIENTGFLQHFTNITALSISNNSITEIDLSHNLNLESITCSDNQITELDLSSHTNLTSINVEGNNLSSLNIANGNNAGFNASRLVVFNATNNPSLSCIQIDEGFTIPTDGSWIKDDNATYSTDCSATNITEEVSNNIRFFPNPTNGHFHISIEENIQSVTIYNMLGTSVYKRSYESLTHDIQINHNLSAGNYIAEISSKSNVFRFNFRVQ